MNQTFGPYSKASKAGNMLFVAGQVGVDTATKRAPVNFSEQMQLAVSNLKQVLSDENLGLNNVKNVRIYLTDMKHYEAMNEIFAEHFTGIAPSRECVAVKSLPPVADQILLVELSAVAELEN